MGADESEQMIGCRCKATAKGRGAGTGADMVRVQVWLQIWALYGNRTGASTDRNGPVIRIQSVSMLVRSLALN